MELKLLLQVLIKSHLHKLFSLEWFFWCILVTKFSWSHSEAVPRPVCWFISDRDLCLSLSLFCFFTDRKYQANTKLVLKIHFVFLQVMNFYSLSFPWESCETKFSTNLKWKSRNTFILSVNCMMNSSELVSTFGLYVAFLRIVSYLMWQFVVYLKGLVWFSE